MNASSASSGRTPAADGHTPTPGATKRTTNQTSGGTFAMSTIRPVTVITVTMVVAVVLTAFAGVSAITTKTSGPAVIKTKLQIHSPTGGDTATAVNDGQPPSFAARYWQQQRDIITGPSLATGTNYDDNEDDDTERQRPHKLSAAQQTHILDDIRRHNQQQQQQWWTSHGSVATDTSTTARMEVDSGENGGADRQQQEPATDQLKELLQINNVVAADDNVAVDNHDDDRHSRQRSLGIGIGGWQPQPVYNNHNRQQQPPLPSLSPYVPPPPTSVTTNAHLQHHQQQNQQQHQQQYYSTTTSAGPVAQYHQNHHHQQQQQLFVTPPSSSVTSTASNTHHHNQQQQQYIPLPPQPHQQNYYPQQQQQPAFISPATAAIPSPGVNGAVEDVNGNGVESDSDIEQQIRQQLTAVVGAGGGNYTILTSPGGSIGSAGVIGNRLQQQVTGSASHNVQYVQVGGGPSSSRNRVQQQPETSATSSIFAGSGSSANPPNTVSDNRNTIVKTVVVRQKAPPPQPTIAASAPPAPAVVSSSASQQQQQPWTINEQQQLEQLARQVLPPGVAQYEIIRAGGIDAGTKSTGDAVTAATDNAQPAVGGVQQQPPVGGRKKPVTFVILEERPDGTVRVRGIEKKQHGGGGAASDGGDAAAAAADSGSTAADDDQLQQLVDKLNRGELRLPTGGTSSPPKTAGADSVSAASSTAKAPLPPFVPSATVSPPLSSGGVSTKKHRDSPPSPYFPTVKPQTTTVAQQQNHYQNVFLPTVSTAAVAVTTSVGGGGQQQQQQQNRYQQQQQQYYSPPSVTTSASTTPYPVNSTSSYNNKGAKEGTFSGALRRRGYYAMAKYMRQAGVDAVLEETGPFTIFVPTDKAFRALLVQLGGPDRAEDKFRENPRLLIGLLLHHVVPGAFKMADLRAGDEMTGVSLAGTQLRANLYSRQLFDNRWNDIEVLTVNGARVLEDVVPAASVSSDDGSPTDDGSGVGLAQQRRDMVLSSRGTAAKGNQQITAIGHAVDRVLFPLPVGDVLATMRADRQRRYSVFLRAVDEHCSPDVRALLSGSRTVTVFAPVDEAFRVRRGSANVSNSGSIVDALLREDTGNSRRNRQRIADRFVLSHVVLAGPGDPPLYTAGLRFYQVRDTAYRFAGSGDSATEGVDDGAAEQDGGDGDDGNASLAAANGESPRYYQLTVYKDSGKIRLNGGAAQVLVRNVPATNGVLHGIDAPLV